MKKLEDIMKDFTNWMEENTLDDLFESHEERIVSNGEDHCETYEVTVRGLSYLDAQSIVEIGLECGTEITFKVEGDKDGNNEH